MPMGENNIIFNMKSPRNLGTDTDDNAWAALVSFVRYECVRSCDKLPIISRDTH